MKQCKPKIPNFFFGYSLVYSSHCHVLSTHANNNVKSVLSSPFPHQNQEKDWETERQSKQEKYMFHSACIDTSQRIQILSPNYLYKFILFHILKMVLIKKKQP